MRNTLKARERRGARTVHWLSGGLLPIWPAGVDVLFTAHIFHSFPFEKPFIFMKKKLYYPSNKLPGAIITKMIIKRFRSLAQTSNQRGHVEKYRWNSIILDQTRVIQPLGTKE